MVGLVKSMKYPLPRSPLTIDVQLYSGKGKLSIRCFLPQLIANHFKSFARKILTEFKESTSKDIEREATNIDRLRNHPNLVHVIAHGSLPSTRGIKRYFIDMELCDYDLHYHIRKKSGGLIKALQSLNAS